MKKLMIAAVAIAAGVAFADDTSSIQSSNIVGYYNKEYAETGFSAAGASFVTVGTNGVFLTQIQPNISQSNGDIQIQLLNKNGASTAIYKYYKGGRGKYATDGWYQTSPTTAYITSANDVFFKAGTGLWMYGKASASYTTSGEVITSDYTITLNAGFQMVANPFATATSLLKITPDISSSNGDIQIQLLNKNGASTAIYKYYKGGRGKYATDGWYQTSPTTAYITSENDVTIAAGAGLWMYGKDGTTVTFTYPVSSGN